MARETPTTYADAGVNIDAGNALVEAIKPAAKSTTRPGVMAGLGGFGGLFDLKAAGYQDPVLVAATDGVGTKLKLAIDTKEFGGIGTDLVAMCVNDLVCQGAEPLFFLDYFATGALDLEQAQQVIEGIARACAECNTALIGGETAEMPGLYAAGDFDLAGFTVGAMERGATLPDGVAEGDVLIGLTSSGVHSNGYSLVRKLIAQEEAALDAPAPFDATRTLAEAVLAPTRLYVTQVLALHKAGLLHGAAHITGGGLSENIPRMIPEGLQAHVDLSRWSLPPLFGWLQSVANLDAVEMLRTFNCGIGMVLAVSGANKGAALRMLEEAGETPIVIGGIAKGDTHVVHYTGASA